jgi:tetratricopeptide (TPR) repeat protein
MERNPKREAGLAAIRGHVNLRLGNLRESKSQFELSLRLREEHSMGAGSIAEAQADLGYVLRRFGKKERAEELLLKGVKDLEKVMSPGFAARAKRKLARYYLEVGNLREAVRQLTQTQALCQKYGLHDQVEESLLLRLPLWMGTRVWRDLQTTEVIETATGYEYVSPTRPRKEPMDI